MAKNKSKSKSTAQTTTKRRAKTAATTTARKRHARIGILCGMETSFPEAVIAYVNDKYADKGVSAAFVQLDAVCIADTPQYDVILDRISHEVPYYRSYLKWAAIKGTYVVNNPFWWSADDKFIDNEIAAAVGVAVPRSVILPHKDQPKNTDDRSFRNLVYPLDWDRVFDYVGFPAFLKPHDGGGWRGVTRVETREDLFAAYDASGTDCMMLQEGIEFEEYYRCYGVNRKQVLVMPYNPIAEPHRRYHDVPADGPSEALHERMVGDVIKICRALGYDMNTVEFAVRDGIPYAIDFMNPAPDAEYNSVGADNFAWVVKQTSSMLMRMARQQKRKKQFDVGRLNA